MARKTKQYDDDDGRVICNMDVEGTRWHDQRVKRENRAMLKASAHGGEQMTRSEARRYTWYSMLAGLTIAAVFSVVIVLFTLFCIYVWFR